MNITLKLFATFRQDRFKIEQRDYPDSILIRDIVAELGIELEACGIIMVNGRHALPEAPLKNDDTLSLFPKVGGG